MHTLKQLRLEATRAANFRGHTLLAWRGSRTRQSTKCGWCGMEVTVDTKPPANGIDVAGEAVALECPWRGGLKSNPRRARRNKPRPVGWRGVPEKHLLKIARDNFKNPAKARFLGGPTPEEARSIIITLTGKDPGPPPIDERLKGNPRRRRRVRLNPDLFDAIRPGDRVTIVNRFGQQQTGRATIINRKDDVVVLNMGGPHGTPGIATRENVVRVVPGKGKRGGFIFNQGNPRRRRRGVQRARRMKKNPRLHFVETIAPNQTIVSHGSVVGFISYKQPVAVYDTIGMKVYVVDEFFSKTTSRHMNAWLRSRGFSPKQAIQRPRSWIEHALEDGQLPGMKDNPALAIIGANPRGHDLGRCLEIRYKRDRGAHKGFYRHPFKTACRLVAMPDGSLRIK